MKQNLLACALVAALGLGLGWGGGGRASNEKSDDALGHGESSYRIELTPVALDQKDGGDGLELAATITNKTKSPVRGIASIRLEDDRGRELGETQISSVLELRGNEDAFALALNTPKLKDGFYRVRANAVFGDEREMLGSELDALYLEVVEGKIELLDMNDWFRRSRAHEVRPQ